MITNIKVDGFRSLREFDFELRPGLNVLVGPNGAGKTNIILFFEFVRLVCNYGAADAVGRMGGAGNIFQKRGKQKFSDSISFSVSGKINVEENSYLYSYSATVKASVAAQEVYFQKQNLVVEKVADGPYINISWDHSDGGDSAVLAVHDYPDEKTNEQIFFGKSDILKYLKNDFLIEHSLVGFLQHALPVVDELRYDLSNRFLLNVVPTVVKAPEDSTRQPGIDSDGSGLSSTLYAIKKKRAISDGVGRAYFRRGVAEPRPASWNRVLSQIKIAVPTIEDIDVENERFDNKLRVKISIGKGTKKAVLPLSALSDGTVKWMSLVVRLATSRAALLIEEPENYLHPLMQQEVVRLLRDSVSDGGFVLLSTHSETLLNAVRVDELVVTSYRAGATRASRVNNASELNQEIALTGFGLGYYYLADAIRT